MQLDLHCNIPCAPDNFSQSSPLDACSDSVEVLVLDRSELVVWNESDTVNYAIALFLPLFACLEVLDHAVAVADLGNGASQMYRNSLEWQSLSQERGVSKACARCYDQVVEELDYYRLLAGEYCIVCSFAG